MPGSTGRLALHPRLWSSVRCRIPVLRWALRGSIHEAPAAILARSARASPGPRAAGHGVEGEARAAWVCGARVERSASTEGPPSARPGVGSQRSAHETMEP
eukprot:7766527-Alexandrium_andersonii.AAC.1